MVRERELMFFLTKLSDPDGPGGRGLNDQQKFRFRD